MPSKPDPVEQALESLAGRAWPGAPHNENLESKLMQSYEHQNRGSYFSRHPVLAPTLALLLVAGVGITAVGAVALYNTWFVTVSVNGGPEQTFEVPVTEDGSAHVTIPVEGFEDGEQTIEVCLDGEGYDANGAKTVSVSLCAEEGVADVTITPEEDEAE